MTSFIDLAKNWVSIDPCDDTKSEIEKMVAAGDESGLEKIMSSRLEFGTAGLRGPMGSGYNRMNCLTILQTCQGLAKYLIEQFGEQEAKSRGAVIGFDHRETAIEGSTAESSLSSLKFARMSAAVFLSLGFKVYLLENLVPTPFVAFGVTHLKCCCGIMVTASHNPMRDNGFKVYWDNGAQIIPPHDSGISRHIEENLVPWPMQQQEGGKYDISDEFIMSHKDAQDVTTAVGDAYYAALLTLKGDSSVGYDMPTYATEEEKAKPLKVAYTAMHGVGGKWVHRAFELFHPDALQSKQLELLDVPSQFSPDPNFPTVSFPNPEEKGALDASQLFAEAEGCGLILANDPDADRLAVAEKNQNGEGWKVFSGNNIGVLLAHWQIVQYKHKLRTQDDSKSNQRSEKGENGENGEKGGAVLTTVVSSRMLKAIAQSEGITYSDTLTGFKWIGNRALEMTKEGYDVLFSYEEAIGFCTGAALCDKDGISGACVFAEMKMYLQKQGVSVQQHLQNLYEKYGEFVSYNSYVFCHDKALTSQIFAKMRIKQDGQDGTDGSCSGDERTGYWDSCAGAKISSVHDITNGFDSDALGNKSALPATPGSEMIMFQFDNGISVTLRTSGTEPKIKFYTEIQGRPGQAAAELDIQLKTFVEAVIAEMLQWEQHGLQRP